MPTGQHDSAHAPRRTLRPGRTLRRGATLASLVLALWARETAALCQATAITPMTFTGYSPVGSGVGGSAVISYRCVGQYTFAHISIETPRTMTGPAGTLAFEVYRNPGYAPTDTFPGTPPEPLDVNGSSITVYGFLPAGQSGPPGDYAATLTVSIITDGTRVRTRTMSVSTVGYIPDCVIRNTGVLAFGDYDPGSAAPLTAAAPITVACAATTPYTVTLDGGGNFAGLRQMTGGALTGTGLLQYEVHSDAGRTAPWLPTTVLAPPPPADANDFALWVYGRIPQGQLVEAGAYSDLLRATFNF